MKRLILAILMIVLAGAVCSTPVLAATSHVNTVKGIEVSPGVPFGNIQYGATFVGRATGTLPGTWTASINYTPPGTNCKATPPTNAIVGGRWTLTVYQNGRFLGTLFGRVLSGALTWNSTCTSASVSGALAIGGGTGLYRGKTGTGQFTATLLHTTFPPSINGSLDLVF